MKQSSQLSTIKAAIKHSEVAMTPEEREAQRRSFAYGNAKIDNPNITRADINAAAKDMEYAEKIAKIFDKALDTLGIPQTNNPKSREGFVRELTETLQILCSPDRLRVRQLRAALTDVLLAFPSIYAMEELEPDNPGEDWPGRAYPSQPVCLKTLQDWNRVLRESEPRR